MKHHQASIPSGIQKLSQSSSILFLLLTLVQLVAQPPPDLTADASTPYAIVERGPNSRVWSRTVYSTNELGEVRTNLNSYTELETGVCRLQNGEWLGASAEIEIVADGAVARQSRHQVIFDANCNTAVAIDLLSADGKRFQSHVLGLSYFDYASGQSVFLAEVKDAIGQLLPSQTEVVYPDAMAGVRVDLTYQNTKAGLEQNIILRARPPAPATFNLNKQTTVLQVLTEFVQQFSFCEKGKEMGAGEQGR